MQEIILPGYTRVNQILSIFQNYSRVPAGKLKRAQEIGTDIHSAIEAFYKETFEPLRTNREPYFESFLKWENAFHPNPIIVEERMYLKPMMITGRIDLLAEIGEEHYLVDFKTGSWAHPEIWKLQGTFYRHLLLSHNPLHQKIPIPNKFMFIQLSPEGVAPNLFTFDYEPHDWDICLNAWECWKYFNKGVDSNGGNVS